VATYAHGDMWDVEHQHRAYDVWRSRHLYWQNVREQINS
jgi:hypothetical protein